MAIDMLLTARAIHKGYLLEINVDHYWLWNLHAGWETLTHTVHNVSLGFFEIVIQIPKRG